MNEEMTQQLVATAERLASAAEVLDRVLEKLDAQQASLNAKVDQIVAAVEERATDNPHEIGEDAKRALEARVMELERANTELKAQSARLGRKTLSPLVSALLAKAGTETTDFADSPVLEKILQPLSVEQRIAVKAEMARAGMIE